MERRPRRWCHVFVLPLWFVATHKDTCPWVWQSCVFTSRFSVSVAVSERLDWCSAGGLLGRVTRLR